MYLTKLERLIFPGFLFAFQVVFLVLFGLLVRYDERGAPSQPPEQQGESDASTVKTYPLFQDVHVMIFVGFGFLMTFLRRYGFSSVGFNFLLASFAIQWSTITAGLYTFIEQDSDTCCKIRVGLESLVGSDFAAAAVLITMGAVLGRASPFQLVIIAFFEVMFYSTNEAINIHVYKAADIGGSMLIHTFGAYFGLGVSFMLFNKKANDHQKNSSVYHSDLFAMIGTLFLWLFWPSFNGALASGTPQYRAIINTYFSMTGGVLASFIFSMALDKNRKLSMTHIQNATLAGGVAVGAVADMVLQPWGALLIGFLAGFVSVIGYRFISPTLEKLYVQDTCGVHNLHGLPGVFAGVASAIAAGVAQTASEISYGDSLFLVFPARAPSNTSELTDTQMAIGIEAGDGRHAGTQAGFQLALLATTLAISIFGGMLTGLIVRWIPAFHDTPDDRLFDDSSSWDLPDDADNYLPDPQDALGPLPLSQGSQIRRRKEMHHSAKPSDLELEEMKIADIPPQSQSPFRTSASTNV